MVPPQVRPTDQASLSETPNLRFLILLLLLVSSASFKTTPSTQPPETEPSISSSGPTNIMVPMGRGALPQVLITVAALKGLPFSSQRSISVMYSRIVKSFV